MELKLPWTYMSEDYLGSRAYSITEAGGLRVALGFTLGDAVLVCKLVNATSEPLTMETFFAYLSGNTSDGYRGLILLPEREVTEEVYLHFLGILPPIYLPNGCFAVPEAITASDDLRGDVHSTFRQEGERFFHAYKVIT